MILLYHIADALRNYAIPHFVRLASSACYFEFHPRRLTYAGAIINYYLSIITHLLNNLVH